ncbi:hypothetical protein LTR36_003943 [Oleoguttula mirabilis]|uniref:Uncharacterized protein n=1 Tax=Oleoguttula mirabilis TaxID=1507867 RepID=A0AAV9JIG0_9PEZI|nr:hypothetical protein LTR36_003943 [Oleoguttula mirabilis]
MSILMSASEMVAGKPHEETTALQQQIDHLRRQMAKSWQLYIDLGIRFHISIPAQVVYPPDFEDYIDDEAEDILGNAFYPIPRHVPTWHEAYRNTYFSAFCKFAGIVKQAEERLRGTPTSKYSRIAPARALITVAKRKADAMQVKMDKAVWALEELIASRNTAAARGELGIPAVGDSDVADFEADFVAWTIMIIRQAEAMRGLKMPRAYRLRMDIKQAGQAAWAANGLA